MVTDKQIADARAVEKAAYAAYTVASAKLEALTVTQACEKYNVGIGKVVVDREGRQFVIRRISPMESGMPWLYGNKIKKDGSPSERETWIRPAWKLVE